VLERHARENHLELPPLSYELKQKRILVAEDNFVNQKVITGYLNRIGYSADIVSNGLEALSILRSKRYDIVLMDCQMPELDGYEATELIRANASPFQFVPIVAMTANAIKGDRERCIEVGMNDYISKPLMIRDLYLILDRWLAGEGLRKLSEKTATIETVNAPQNHDQIIDIEMIHDLQSLPGGNGGHLVSELYEGFCKNGPARIQAMKEAVPANDLQKLAFEAHALKGGAGALGLSRLRAIAQLLEEAEQGDCVEDLPGLMIKLEKEFQLALVELAKYSDKTD
jgi:CheY-like chemotaxis protein